jgi:hypothetical protein
MDIGADGLEPHEQCCTLPPFSSDYVPVGETIQLGIDSDVSGQKLDVYITGPADATTALVAIYGKCCLTSSFPFFLYFPSSFLPSEIIIFVHVNDVV